MNVENLKNHLPTKVYEELPSAIKLSNLTTPLRLSHFLAQCAHESGNWKFTVENLNYSSEALQSVFRKYFPDPATAAHYARKPEKIANRAYANRMGNGDEASGDGWKFRGRGYIQLTGKYNYSRFNEEVEENLLETPDIVATQYPLLSASWFWNVNNLNSVADKGTSNEIISAVTRRVNGGLHGIEDRIKKFNGYHALLT